jgi:hypothetical protein
VKLIAVRKAGVDVKEVSHMTLFCMTGMIIVAWL